MADNTEIFRKIDDKVEQQKIFSDLAVRNELIQCKGKNSQIYSFRAFRHTNNDVLLCSLADNSPTPKSNIISDIICSFSLGLEKYYFQSKLFRNRLDFTLNTRADLFLLQRRLSYRIRLPLTYKAGLEIRSVDNNIVKIPAMIFDLSSRGARIIVQKNKFTPKAGQTFTAVMSIKSEPAIAVTATVKHFVTEPRAKQAWAIGCQFASLDKNSENYIYGITMDLHRELFSRWKY